MSISARTPFKGRQYSGEVSHGGALVLAVSLGYQHVSELLAERGLAVDASCIWRWVQVYAAELSKRCMPGEQSGMQRALDRAQAAGVSSSRIASLSSAARRKRN